jgi:hypothetical protein
MDPIGRIIPTSVPLGTPDQQNPSKLLGFENPATQKLAPELLNLKAETIPLPVQEQVVFSAESSAVLQKVDAPEIDLTTPEEIATRLKTLVEENARTIGQRVVQEEPEVPVQAKPQTTPPSTPDADSTYAPPAGSLLAQAEEALAQAVPPQARPLEQKTQTPATPRASIDSPANQPATNNTTNAGTAAKDGATSTTPNATTAPSPTTAPPPTGPANVPSGVLIQDIIVTEFGAYKPAEIPDEGFTPLIKDGAIQSEAHFNQPDPLLQVRAATSGTLAAVKASASGLSAAIKDPHPTREGTAKNVSADRVIKDPIELPQATPAQQALAAKVLSRLAAAVNESIASQAFNRAAGPALQIDLPLPQGAAPLPQAKDRLNQEARTDTGAQNLRVSLGSEGQKVSSQLPELLGRIPADAIARMTHQTTSAERVGDRGAYSGVENVALHQNQERAGTTQLLANLPFGVNSSPPSLAHLRVERFDEKESSGRKNEQEAPRRTYTIAMELQTPDVGLVKVRLAYTGVDLNGTVVFRTPALAEHAGQFSTELEAILRQATGVEKPMVAMRSETSGY